jgi:hypothetical protein
MFCLLVGSNGWLGGPIESHAQSTFQLLSGSITNRFSQDIDLIDMRLPAWAVNTVASKQYGLLPTSLINVHRA